MYHHVLRTKQVALPLAALTLFGAFFAVGVIVAPESDAADLGYRYYSRTISVGDCSTSYSFEAGGAALDYDLNTDLSVSFYYNNCTRPVKYLEGNFGATTWHANSVSMNNQGQTCSYFTNTQLTGLCNTTTKKAYTATIYINNHSSWPRFQNGHWAMRHELGHVFGMAHLACSADSVMRQFETCSGNPSILRPYDTSLINNWY